MSHLVDDLFTEVLRDAYRYVPAIAPARPTLDSTPPGLSRTLLYTAHRGRNLLERTAARGDYVRRHFDPVRSEAALQRILALRDGFEHTAGLLGDEASRRAMLDVLKLRVLGPYHAPLWVTADRYRAMQKHIDQTMMRQARTFDVADPLFPSVGLYDVQADGSSIALHSHSAHIASVFLLNQYTYPGCVEAQSGDVVLDVGGGFGDTALYFADRVGAAGKIFVFEFVPENLKIMRANLELNPHLADRIEIVSQPAWSASGEILNFAPEGQVTTLVGASNGHGLTAETIALDDFVKAAGITRVNFVKMDVEGAEGKVLAGASQTLSRHMPKLALAAYHKDDDLVEIPRSIRAAGDEYRCFVRSASPLEDETIVFARSSRSSVDRPASF